MAATSTVGSDSAKKKSKRKVEEVSLAEGEKRLVDGAGPDVQSLMCQISKTFGVGGFLGAKKRKIETHKGSLTPLKDEWNFRDIIQNLPPEIQQRYTMELSLKSFKILKILKRTILCFKQLSRGRKFLKDPVMDIYLKDIKTRPMLPLPNRYIEIGLWKQVMQVNQQLCRRMDQLEKVEEQFAGDVEEESGKFDEERKLDKSGEELINVSDKNKSFRDYYMEMLTAGFGDDLDRLRQDGTFNPRKVELLVSCLESGTDIWSDLEKNLLQLSRT